MQTIRTNSLNRIAITFAVLAGGTWLAAAQPEPGDRPQRRPLPAGEDQPQRGSQFRPQPGALGGGALMAVMRVLTEEQRQSLRGQMQTQREQASKIEEQLRDARKELFAASLAEKFDEAAVREKALNVAKLEAELTVIRAKALSQI